MSISQDLQVVIGPPMTDRFVAQGMAAIVPPVMRVTKIKTTDPLLADLHAATKIAHRRIEGHGVAHRTPHHSRKPTDLKRCSGACMVLAAVIQRGQHYIAGNHIS